MQNHQAILIAVPDSSLGEGDLRRSDEVARWVLNETQLLPQITSIHCQYNIVVSCNDIIILRRTLSCRVANPRHKGARANPVKETGSVPLLFCVNDTFDAL